MRQSEVHQWCSSCHVEHHKYFICPSYGSYRTERILREMQSVHKKPHHPKLPDSYKIVNGGWLPLNQMVRFNHEECGDTKERLYVKRTARGFLFHCHNCGDKFSGFSPTLAALPPSDTAKNLTQAAEVETKQVISNFPPDYTQDLPEVATRWLLKYGITKEEATRFRIGWSEEKSRVILPVHDLHDEKTLLMWQERAVLEGQVPKYKTYHMTEDIDTANFEYINGTTVVLVEDMLSAIKVGRVWSSLCLHGSYLPTSLIRRIRKYDHIVVWLDNDKYKDACRFARMLAMRGLDVAVANTPKDPKEYTERQIQEVVREAFFKEIVCH